MLNPADTLRSAASCYRAHRWGHQSQDGHFPRSDPPVVRSRADGAFGQILVLGLVFSVIALICDNAWGPSAGMVRAWFAKSPRRVELIGGIGGLPSSPWVFGSPLRAQGLSLPPLLRSQQSQHLAPPGRPARAASTVSGWIKRVTLVRPVPGRKPTPGSRPLCRLGVVGALEDVAVPGRHEEGLEELAVRGHILVHPPTGSSEASLTMRSSAMVHKKSSTSSVSTRYSMRIERAVFRMDVLADRK